jgi:AcrR family transcriptional regulator
MSAVLEPGARRAGRPRRDTVALRQDALLDTALQLFLQHGYAEVTLVMLARTARVAIRTIYTQFGGKAGLLNALIDAEHRRHGEQLEALALDNLARQGGDALPELRAGLERLAQHVAWRSNRADLVRLQTIVAAEAEAGAAQALYAAGPGQAMALLQALLVRAMKASVLRSDFRVEHLAALFFSCVCGSRVTLWAGAAMPTLPLAHGLELFFDAVLAGD